MRSVEERRAAQRERYTRNREEILLAQKARWKNDPAWREAKLEKSKAWAKKRQQDPAWREKQAGYRVEYLTDPSVKERYRAHRRKNNTGFGPVLVGLTRKAQEGCCALCKVQLVVEGPNCRSREHADHDHITGEPRGLLCLRCNTDLARYERLRDLGAESYLQNPPVRQLVRERIQAHIDKRKL